MAAQLATREAEAGEGVLQDREQQERRPARLGGLKNEAEEDARRGLCERDAACVIHRKPPAAALGGNAAGERARGCHQHRFEGGGSGQGRAVSLSLLPAPGLQGRTAPALAALAPAAPISVFRGGGQED